MQDTVVYHKFGNLLGSEREIVTAVPMYNFINTLFRINLAILSKFAIHYGLKAT